MTDKFIDTVIEPNEAYTQLSQLLSKIPYHADQSFGQVYPMAPEKAIRFNWLKLMVLRIGLGHSLRKLGFADIETQGDAVVRKAYSELRKEGTRLILLARHPTIFDGLLLIRALGKAFGWRSLSSPFAFVGFRAAVSMTIGHKRYSKRGYSEYGVLPVSLPDHLIGELRSLEDLLKNGNAPVVMLPERYNSFQNFRMVGHPPLGVVRMMSRLGKKLSVKTKIMPVRVAVRVDDFDVARFFALLDTYEADLKTRLPSFNTSPQFPSQTNTGAQLDRAWSQLARITLAVAGLLNPEAQGATEVHDARDGFSRMRAALRSIYHAVDRLIRTIESFLGLPSSGILSERSCRIAMESMNRKYPEGKSPYSIGHQQLRAAQGDFITPLIPFMHCYGNQFEGTEPRLENSWQAVLDLSVMTGMVVAAIKGQPFANLPEIGRWVAEIQFCEPTEIEDNRSECESKAAHIYQAMAPHPGPFWLPPSDETKPDETKASPEAHVRESA